MDFIEIETELCGIIDDYPSRLFADRSEAGLPLKQRVCCAVRENVPISTCPADISSKKDSSLIIIMCTVIASCVICAAVAFVVYRL